MDLFKKIGDVIETTGKDVAQRAKEVSDIARLNLHIRDEESSIRNRKMLLAEKYMEVVNGEPEESLKEYVEEIQKSMEKIVDYRKEINRLKKLRLCTNCNVLIPEDANYCSKCGEKAPQPAPEVVNEEETKEEDIIVESALVKEPVIEDAVEVKEHNEQRYDGE